MKLILRSKPRLRHSLELDIRYIDSVRLCSHQASSITRQLTSQVYALVLFRPLIIGRTGSKLLEERFNRYASIIRFQFDRRTASNFQLNIGVLDGCSPAVLVGLPAVESCRGLLSRSDTPSLSPSSSSPPTSTPSGHHPSLSPRPRPPLRSSVALTLQRFRWLGFPEQSDNLASLSSSACCQIFRLVRGSSSPYWLTASVVLRCQARVNHPLVRLHYLSSCWSVFFLVGSH